MKCFPIIAAICFVAPLISSQPRSLSKVEFETVVKAGKKALETKLRGNAFRVTTTVEARNRASKPVVTVIETFESSRNGATRVKREENVFGQKHKVEEHILLGGIGYSRTGDGNWNRAEFQTLGPMERPLLGPEADGFEKRTISEKFEYFHMGVRRLEDEDWDAYSSVDTKDVVYEINANDLKTTTTDIFYFRIDGTIARRERVTIGFSLRNGSVSDHRLIVQWDLDPMIVVKAPVLSP